MKGKNWLELLFRESVGFFFSVCFVLFFKLVRDHAIFFTKIGVPKISRVAIEKLEVIP